MSWFEEYTTKELNRFCENSMVDHLHILFTEIGADYLKAKMPVNSGTVQPMGLLHGGATAALAETIGSVAAFMSVDPQLFNCVGLEINCNHIKGISKGDVLGTGRPLHIGSKTQVWEIKITDEEENLVGVSRLTLAVITKKQ